MKKNPIEREITLYVWAYALIVIAVLLILKQKDYTIAFALGVCANMFAFVTTIKSVDRIVKYGHENPRKVTIFNSIIKFFLYGVILGLVAYIYRDGITIIFCFFGMLSVKIMIYFKRFILEPLINRKNKHKIEEENDE